ncbi:MAG: 16S rRNA (adenine(1518)-N(6)/adenine(1519)-N(6))-dimethyltransferase RsmA [Clostridia bacterium]|nr:16S rRNA (adenine(1518)-N(6)/adenine(1519)-N(6))-dimethyltransferase RsmA [Clostridia bacterium]
MKLTDLSVIRSLLGEEGTSFKKKYGQNFLTNESVVERIAASALPDVPDPVERLGILEIGPGIGVLTQKLSAVAQKVTAVEIDSTLLPILEKTLADCDNVHVVNNDIMKVDLPALVAEEFADCTRLAVCANLPYYITTPILMALLESKLPFSSITVMVQKEVAERLCAPAGSDAYGAITAVLCYYGTPRRLFTVSAGNFVPAPKVDSAVVQIKLHKSPPVKVADEAKLFAVIKAAFGQRRKTLQNALAALPGIGKEQIACAIAAAGLSPTVRGEALGLEQFAQITDLLYEGAH